jgi:hypothetical protein
MDIEPQQKRRLWKSALTLTTVSAQYTTLLIALSMNLEQAHWNNAEVNALVNYLYEHRLEAGDGGSFKDVTFNNTLTSIAPLLSQGPVKTGKMCKTKWSAICCVNHSI